MFPLVSQALTRR